MSCTKYGMPVPYSGAYPESSEYFYRDPPNDPYANYMDHSTQQSLQLNLNSLMPASWNNVSATQAATGSKDDWSRYSVSREGVERYISAQGINRYQQLSRSSQGRLTGTPNLLRSQPPAALSLGSGPDSCNVIFNDSSLRQALVTPAMKPWIGCG